MEIIYTKRNRLNASVNTSSIIPFILSAIANLLNNDCVKKSELPWRPKASTFVLANSKGRIDSTNNRHPIIINRITTTFKVFVDEFRHIRFAFYAFVYVRAFDRMKDI